jgi:hypothetical protein
MCQPLVVEQISDGGVCLFWHHDSDDGVREAMQQCSSRGLSLRYHTVAGHRTVTVTVNTQRLMISGATTQKFDQISCAMEAQSRYVDGAIFRKKTSQAFNSAYAAPFVLSVLEVECQEGRGNFEEPSACAVRDDADLPWLALSPVLDDVDWFSGKAQPPDAV